MSSPNNGFPGWRGQHWHAVERLAGEREAAWCLKHQPAWARPRGGALDGPAGGVTPLPVGIDPETHGAPLSLVVPPAAARAREARPSLEDVTLKNASFAPGPAAPGADQVELRLTYYPDGIRGACFVRPALPGTSKKTGDYPKSKPTDGERFAGSISRSRRDLCHRARCLQIDHMWTFGKRGKFADLEQLWAAWKRFDRLALKRFGKKRFQYVCVPELHADGETWHIHAGFKGFFDVIALRILWARALGGTGRERGPDTLGNVDARDFRRRGGARAIWAYISGYCGKGFDQAQRHRRLYSSSKGIADAPVRRWHALVDLPHGALFVDAAEALQLGVGRVTDARARYVGANWFGWFECRSKPP